MKILFTVMVKQFLSASLVGITEVEAEVIAFDP